MSRCAGMKPASAMMRRSSLFVGAVAHAGGEHHVFFDQDAAHVVGAELQAHLADLDSRRQPARLDVVDVVQIQPADGQRLQVIDGRGFRHFLAQRGIFRREHPRNERGEAAGIFLDAAQAFEVIDAVAVPRRSRTSSWRWCACPASARRGACLPIRRRCTSGARSRANFVVQNFRAAAGNRVQARVHQPLNRFAHAQLGNFRDAPISGAEKQCRCTCG